MRMEDEPRGTVCRLVTPCTWGFQEIVLGRSPAAELLSSRGRELAR